LDAIVFAFISSRGKYRKPEKEPQVLVGTCGANLLFDLFSGTGVFLMKSQ
jgi:hypothetical protein